jgi:hypothetical protein
MSIEKRGTLLMSDYRPRPKVRLDHRNPMSPPKVDRGLEKGVGSLVVALAVLSWYSVIQWKKPKG